MPKINNVDIEKIKVFTAQIKEDPAKGRKTQVIEGEWLLKEDGAQFESIINFENGQSKIQAASPSFMGGTGNLPGPLQYCLFGLANCYTALFAIIAAAHGIEIKKLTIRIEADINFSKVFDIVDKPIKEEISITRKEKEQFEFSFWTIDQPIVEEVRIILKLASNAPPEKVKEIDLLTHSRCPAIYMLKNPIKFTSNIEIINEE